MKISTKGRYALRVLLDLAEHRNEGFIPLKDISRRQEISKKYLEQIIPVFAKAGFVETVRGAQGGYRLAGDPEKYSVGDILRMTEGSLCPVDCVEKGAKVCPRCSDCLTLPIWQEYTKMVNDYFDSISLADILDRREKERKAGDYVI